MDGEPDSRVVSIDVEEAEFHVSGQLCVAERRATLVMEGSLCTHSSRVVAEDLHRWIDSVPGAAVGFDLAGLDFIDARGLTLLIELQRHVASGGGSSSIVAMSNSVARLFELCGLETPTTTSHLATA